MSYGLGQAQPISRYADLDRGPRRVVVVFVVALTLFIGGLVAWMNIAELDISVNATGSVVPSSKVQQIQSLEGGIVREIAVHVGQEVKEGDLLLRLEDMAFNSELGELKHNYWGQLAALARLDAEMNERDPVFSREVMSNAPEIVSRERQLWISRKKERRAMLDAARGQIDQRRQELAETRSRVASLKASVSIAEEQMTIEKQLFDTGAGSRADFLRAKQEVTRTRGELSSASINVSRLNASVREAQARRAEIETRFKSEVNQLRSQYSTETAAMTEAMSGKKDKVTRRDLFAPMDGVVNRLLVSTVGGVAKAGETIMEIVPVDDNLMIAAKVDPKDIAFIRPGQDAQVRITAYDSSIYGALKGKVERIGVDAVLDEKKNAYFEVYLKTDSGYTAANGQQLRISPGMMTETSISTGERTLLEYLLKPIVKTFNVALTER